MISKAHILEEIQRTAGLNEGAPLGIERFFTETGIKTSDWLGKHWVRWGDALIEAGFQPNQFQRLRSDDDLLSNLASFVRELGRFPVTNELKLKARTEPGFPWHNTFARFGSKKALVARLSEFCKERGDNDLEAICSAIAERNDQGIVEAGATTQQGSQEQLNYVYLMKSGRYCKIGRTNAVGRREREIGIQLPEALKLIHSIKTDDPVGIEEYWHKRFNDRRKNGEWFELTAQDIGAFKRRKFM